MPVLRPKHLFRLSLGLITVSASALLAGMPALAQQVIPDGGTVTQMGTPTATGRPTVEIATPNASRISHNTYTEFSVGAAGLNLDNSAANPNMAPSLTKDFASTIVNEVTSSRRSTIGGPIEVLGHSAHIIIANPNGITVDGGSFINTGGVVLSGGTVSYAPSLTSPGMVNAIVNSGSDIEVTGKGLASAMPTLQLIANRIKVDGPISNSNPSPDADININAGDAQLTLDSSVSPSSTIRNWATKTKSGTGNSDEILVDVTPQGSLSASRVQIAVNAKGAGVSFAGTGNAAIGGFSITADGKVSVTGAKIQAEKTVKIVGRSIDIGNNAAAQSTVSSVSGGVTLLANDGDINLEGQISGAQRPSADSSDPDYDPDAKGAVTMAATGDINLLSQSADRLAIAFADKGDLWVTAGGNVNNDTGRLLSNHNVLIDAGGAVNNTVDVVGAVNGGQAVTRVVHGPNFFFGLFGGHRSRHVTTVTYGDLRLPNQLGYIVGQGVFINSDSVTNTGEIDAQDGAMKITTGSLVNGGVATGSMTTIRKCNIFFCTTRGGSTVSNTGGKINASLSLEIDASLSIANNGGQIVSYDNMILKSPQITATAFFAPEVVTQPGGLEKFFSGKRGWVVEQPIGGQFITPVGSITVETGQPVVLDGGELLANTTLINPAGVVVKAPATSRFVTPPQHIGIFRGAFE